jgi:starvation-inducible DNA-binding protein
MEMIMHNTKIDISAENRQDLVNLLNQRLADVTDLKSQAKQAHWNVKGMNFIALHELFDKVAAAADAHTDLIAERITTLGGTAYGTIRQASHNSSLAEYPLEITDGTAHVDALSSVLADLGRMVRSDIDRASELGDQDTADLLTEISRETDKNLWFVEAHIQS